MTDRQGYCVAVNLYNLAPGKGVIIGDSVAIAEPNFRRIDIKHKGQVCISCQLWHSYFLSPPQVIVSREPHQRIAYTYI